MGIRLIVEVLDHYHGSAVKKLWLLAFAEKANDNTRLGWPGRDLLARRTGKSATRVSNIATELVGDGILKRVGGGGKNRGETKYSLLPLMSAQSSEPPNPEETAQGSEAPNPEEAAQGSESATQGSESAAQGSDVSLVPAETSRNPQNPHRTLTPPTPPGAKEPALSGRRPGRQTKRRAVPQVTAATAENVGELMAEIAAERGVTLPEGWGAEVAARVIARARGRAGSPPDLYIIGVLRRAWDGGRIEDYLPAPATASGSAELPRPDGGTPKVASRAPAGPPHPDTAAVAAAAAWFADWCRRTGARPLPEDWPRRAAQHILGRASAPVQHPDRYVRKVLGSAERRSGALADYLPHEWRRWV